MENQTITAIQGIKVGHAHNLNAGTGCTVILCPPNTVGGVDQRGGAPGTRETDLLRPMHLIQHVHAILLTGGSAYGLNAAAGVMSYLERQGIGYDVGVGVVPIVPAAVIFDLDFGMADIRPDMHMGYQAAETASALPVQVGCVGAGVGAKVGMLNGIQFACKSGVGSVAITLGEGVIVGALMVVNAFGDVIDDDGTILAGTRQAPEGRSFIDSFSALSQLALMPSMPTNTVIGVVATNAKLNKEEANKVAQMAHNGIAQAVRPAHTMYDGDTIFALATGEFKQGNVNVLGAYAAKAVAMAIRQAVEVVTPLGNLPTGKHIRENISW
ncbi:MAG: peptidase S58 [Phototrophicales bacterium]|nr:MAG: peptidase S58 [Phototrophicales bacterium]